MECQVEKNEHFRHLLLFAFNQGSKAAKAARDICAVYGEGAIAERTARDWYAKFKNGNFDLKDAPRSGRPVEFDEERLNQLLHVNSRQTTRELAEKMECSHTAIEKHLHSMGKVQKCGAWVPHALTDNNKNQRATISVGCQNFHF
ncbi:Histone-lysine N-methyltransferase SETMAR [Habropoda laboriosa]|uniref:Histone-lysine N-methyltransferase SETMAR n=1 Tax=Habropoda laboriosa TaxID=597456 RepID=A0A0L7R067_9HYME|nr:Histone-lysine N-methyltransferase SETMAR [Habropoda laboriosa]